MLYHGLHLKIGNQQVGWHEKTEDCNEYPLVQQARGKISSAEQASGLPLFFHSSKE